MATGETCARLTIMTELSLLSRKYVKRNKLYCRGVKTKMLHYSLRTTVMFEKCHLASTIGVKKRITIFAAKNDTFILHLRNACHITIFMLTV